MSRNKIFWIFLVALVVCVGGFLWLSSRYVTPILMYHHVDLNPAKRVDVVAPERFAEQMKYLADHGYHVIPAGEYASAVNEGRRLPSKSVVITFDDGYENVYHNAFPVLKQYGFRSTLFMISDFFSREKFLSMDQLKEMMAAGMEIGSHTRHHLYLPGVLDSALGRESWR